jgi:hypothetical protein
VALGSEAQQVIADGSAKNVGRRASASPIDRPGVRQVAGAQRLHGSNAAPGNTRRATFNAAALTASSERLSQQSPQSADTLADVGAADGTVITNAPACAPSANFALQLMQVGLRAAGQGCTSPPSSAPAGRQARCGPRSSEALRGLR